MKATLKTLLLSIGICLYATACNDNLEVTPVVKAPPKKPKDLDKPICETLINQVKDAALQQRLRAINNDPTKLNAVVKGSTALQDAVEKGELIAIDALVKAGADTNATGQLERTALHTAVRSGSPETLDKLLSIEGVDVNKLDQWKYTPLHLAIHRGNIAAIKKLAAHPDINFSIEGVGGTPLQYAEATKDVDICLVKEQICAILKKHGAT